MPTIAHTTIHTKPGAKHPSCSHINSTHYDRMELTAAPHPSEQITNIAALGYWWQHMSRGYIRDKFRSPMRQGQKVWFCPREAQGKLLRAIKQQAATDTTHNQCNKSTPGYRDIAGPVAVTGHSKFTQQQQNWWRSSNPPNTTITDDRSAMHDAIWTLGFGTCS